MKDRIMRIVGLVSSIGCFFVFAFLIFFSMFIPIGSNIERCLGVLVSATAAVAMVYLQFKLLNWKL